MTPDRFKIYARLSNGKITEYPVSYLHVTERELASGAIQEVDASDVIPIADKMHNVVSKVSVVLGKPKITYELTAKTPREFVEENYIALLRPYFDLIRLDVASIPTSVIKEMVDAVRDLGTYQLNRFAQQKEYDSIESLISYRGDEDPVFSAEAEIGFKKRSQYWSTLKSFRERIMSGADEFPRTADAILQMFPELTWE